MFAYLTSEKGAVLVSTLGLLAFVAYAFLVSRYVLEDLAPGRAPALVETLVVLLIVGAWVWGLLSASGGAQQGWTILLICSLLPTLFTIYDLTQFSPFTQDWPLFQIVVWATFVVNAVASVVVFLVRRG